MHGHPTHPELGLWATIHKETGQLIGRSGLLPWTIDGQNEVEVAYLLGREYWGQGLGTEVAQAILDFGFDQLHLSRLICLIDAENLASIKVAEKIGMKFEKEGKDKIGPFLLYSRNIDRSISLGPSKYSSTSLVQPLVRPKPPPFEVEEQFS